MGKTVHESITDTGRNSTTDGGWIVSVLIVHTDKTNEAIGGNQPGRVGV